MLYHTLTDIHAGQYISLVYVCIFVDGGVWVYVYMCIYVLVYHFNILYILIYSMYDICI